MVDHESNDPLHGLTLETIVTRLVGLYGFATLGELVPIHCFQHEPSIRSSLKFLRRMPWARSKVEALYVATTAEGQRWDEASAGSRARKDEP
jgi:uncharacterized protein (DUF2132 family)